MKLILLALMATAILPGQTHIRDTGYTGVSGTKFSGKVTISAPDMTTSDGRTVLRWQQDFTIPIDGAISFDLEPNDTAAPSGTSYLVHFKPSRGGPSGEWSERWIVPTSATPLLLSQIRILPVPWPLVMIQPQQILGGGASSGQCLAWTGSSWGPIDCAGSVTGGGVPATNAPVLEAMTSTSAVFSYMRRDQLPCSLHVGDDTGWLDGQPDAGGGMGSRRWGLLADLSPSTAYSWAQTCGVELYTGGFTTPAAMTGSVNYGGTLPVLAEATQVRIDYGGDPALGSTATFSCTAGSCIWSLPVTKDTLFFWRVTYMDEVGPVLSDGRVNVVVQL